jgi:hypothetical protein
MKNRRVIDETSYDLLLKGQGVYDKSQQPAYREQKELHDFLTEQQWDLAHCMEARARRHFAGLVGAIVAHQDELRAYMRTDAPDGSSVLDLIPGALRKDLPTFQQLLLIKLFKPV